MKHLPVNDAREMTRALQELGFEVMKGENLSQNEMKRQSRLFGDKIRNGGGGLFYFAGHGIASQGQAILDQLIASYFTIKVYPRIGRKRRMRPIH